MKGPESQEQTVAVPKQLIFSLAENIKDSLVVVPVSTIVKFLLITCIEVFRPCLCTIRTILTNFFLFNFFLLINRYINDSPTTNN